MSASEAVVMVVFRQELVWREGAKFCSRNEDIVTSQDQPAEYWPVNRWHVKVVEGRKRELMTCLIWSPFPGAALAQRIVVLTSILLSHLLWLETRRELGVIRTVDEVKKSSLDDLGSTYSCCA
jgi:hypothetical protein